MTDCTSVPNSPRMRGTLLVGAILAGQQCFGLLPGCGLFSLMAIGLICMAPALVFLATPYPGAAIIFSVFIAPWMLWANVTECLLSTGKGGAPMAYIGVAFWGFAPGLVAGMLWLAGWGLRDLIRRRARRRNRHRPEAPV